MWIILRPINLPLIVYGVCRQHRVQPVRLGRYPGDS